MSAFGKRWVWRKGEGCVEVTSDRAPPQKGLIVVPDIAPYRSMETGERIGGRRQHREHLKRHGMIEVGNEKVSGEKPKRRPVGEDLRRALQVHGWS